MRGAVLRRVRGGWRRGVVGVATATAVCGCDAGTSGGEVELPVEALPGTVRVGDGSVPFEHVRPDSIVSLLMIEGTPEPMVFRLFRSPSRFPAPFSTYLPEGLRATDAGGDTLRFVFREADVESGPTVEVVLLPPGISREEATRLAAASLGPGASGALEGPRPGVVAAFRGADRGRVARTDLLRDYDRWLLLRWWYPPEFGDGMGPRVHHLRATWVWDMTGEPLVEREGR